ncbi:MAG: MATE family efflux transporter [Raineya sp.]|jgi:MATE family multidrug resistance protein|nr:MATE family efflux transporter [Raineya sp.]
MSKIYTLYRLYRLEIKNTILFSIPIVIAQLGVVLMGVIDTIMIRDLGVVATAAAGATNDTFFLVTMLSLGSMNIIAPLISQAYQKKDLIEAKKTWLSGLVLALFLGLLTTGILWTIIENFDLLRQEPAVTVEAKAFLWQLLWSILPMLVFLACKQFTDGLSLTKVAMTLTWVGLGLNVCLNWLLINGNWGFPKMGVAGAGLATTLARVVMMLCILTFIFTNKQTKAIIHSKVSQLEWAFIWKIFRMGLPVGITYFLEIVAFSVAGLLIGGIDHYSQAAHRVVISLVSTTYMITSGISIASAIRIGKAYAGLHLSKIKKIGSSAIIVAVGIMSIFCVIFLTVPEILILPLMENDPKAVSIAIMLLIVAGFFQISDGVQAVGLGILRGMEDVNIPTIIALIAYWVIALPLSVLAYTQGWGAMGIWVALLLGLSTSAILLTTRFFKLLKHKRKEIA